MKSFFFLATAITTFILLVVLTHPHHRTTPSAPAASEPTVNDDWEPKGAVGTYIGKFGSCDVYRVHPRLSTTTMYITQNTDRYVQCGVFQAR